MRALVLATVGLAATTAPVHAEETQPYVVQPGDSCLSIAIRVVGARTAVRDLHRLNPDLGALPHRLVPGTLLQLPRPADEGPDAQLTRATGNVTVRKPSTVEWDRALRGMDLFRAYRVGAASQASAQLTFGDDGQLEMRERTIVVIYGPEKQKASVIRATAELQRGTLEARLGELDGKRIVVRTPAADTDVRTAQLVIGTGDGGPSLISNHRGAAVSVRGRTTRRSAVKVAAGMGTRVMRGKPPEPPRPLPATPAWSTSAGPQLVGPTGSISVAWAAVDRASRYRVAIRDAAGDLIRALHVAAPASTVLLPLDPGAYELTVAALDADGLESAPSPSLEIAVVKPVFVAPSGRTPGAGAAAPRVVALGTTVVAPATVACTVGAQPAERTVLARVGTAELVCVAADGRRSPPLAIEVIALASRASASR